MPPGLFLSDNSLSSDDLELLRALDAYERESNGLGPSMRELAARMGRKSHATVVKRVRKLHKKGYLTIGKLPGKRKSRPNSVQLTEEGRDEIRWRK